MAASDAVTFWLDNAGRQPLLTAAEELHLGGLVRSWQDHPNGPADAPPVIRRRGIRARDRFVAANLRLVAHVTRLTRPGLGAHVSDSDLPDLLQAGAIGLVRGAERFDPSRGYKFSTFAYWWVRQGISRWCDASSRTIKLPCTHAPKLARYGRMGQRLTAVLGRQPTRLEMADALGMRVDDLELVLMVGLPLRSLDAQRREGDEHSSLGEILAAPAPEEHEPEMVELHRRLAHLDPLSARLVHGRWGLGGHVLSVRMLAAAEGIRVGQVRALLAAAEQQLKGQPAPPKLIPWEKGEACQLTLSLDAAETKAMAAIGA
jgi:RNA polymerase primary sigma factor